MLTGKRQATLTATMPNDDPLEQNTENQDKGSSSSTVKPVDPQDQRENQMERTEGITHSATDRVTNTQDGQSQPTEPAPDCTANKALGTIRGHTARDRRYTEKMELMLEGQQQKREQKFTQTYERWKQEIRSTRIQLKAECTEELLGSLLDGVQTLESRLAQTYNDMRRHGMPKQEIVRRMDSCSAVTKDIVLLIQHRISEVGEHWDDTAERLRLHTLLDRDYAHSAYGASILRPSIASASIASSHHTNKSELSSIAAKRADTAAQLAAQRAELQAIDEQESQRATLEREIKRLDTQKQIKVTEAKLNVYAQEFVSLNQNPGDPPESPTYNVDGNELSHRRLSEPPNKEIRNAPNADLPSVTMIQEATTKPAEMAANSRAQTASSTEYATLANVLQSSLMLSRLPLPEPTIFNGDPLHYTEWKAAFVTLIDNKAIIPQEKFYFLKKYVGKEAGKAVQGYFLSHTEDSYQAAWRTLEERYGNPFILQRAFREKLSSWTTIGPKDADGLREFADFLQGCQKAMTHIPSLQVLNDCMENQRLIQKLPNWAFSRWNRKVTKQLQETGIYPSFDTFVDFVVDEARIACNPVSSLNALNEKPTREPKRRQASVMATNTDPTSNRKSLQNKGKTEKEKEGIKKCPLCDSDTHYLPKCSSFAQKSLQERRKFVQEQKRCYGCLRVSHNSKSCQNKHTCQICKGKHPTCLHDNNFQSKTVSESASHENTTERASTSAAALHTNSNQEYSATSTVVPVWVSTEANPQREKLVYALLDTQSNTTFIDQATSQALSAESESVKLQLTTMMEKDSDITCERVTGLQVRGYNSEVLIKVPTAYTREFIPADLSHIPTIATAKNWKHLTPIASEVPPLLDCDVGLLIGYNCPQALVPREVITGRDNEPFAIRMDLGWSIVGRASPTAHSLNVSAFCHRTSTKESPFPTPADALRLLEKDFRDTDGLDQASQEDLRFLNILEQGISKTADGHYQMPLPFRQTPSLQNNRTMALTRLNQLKRKLERNTQYREDYLNFMEEMIKRGDAEKAVDTHSSTPWYIPHHVVYHPCKEKIRVVFDCSARFQGQSLNDNLLVGPDLVNSLVGVLCRFRQYPVAVMCDIEKMFHQFYVNEQDHDFLRFLWWEGSDLSTQPVDYRMKVHLFGATLSPGCANYGLKHLAKENKAAFPLGSNFIEHNFYVDDGLISEPTKEQAIQVVEQARSLCATGGLGLHKFVSNNRTVMESIPLSERAADIQNLDLNFDNLPNERALGMEWSVESDTLHFSFSPTERPTSRRGILATVASLYDPLGLIAPYVFQGKKLPQDMC